MEQHKRQENQGQKSSQKQTPNEQQNNKGLTPTQDTEQTTAAGQRQREDKTTRQEDKTKHKEGGTKQNSEDRPRTNDRSGADPHRGGKNR